MSHTTAKKRLTALVTLVITVTLSAFCLTGCVTNSGHPDSGAAGTVGNLGTSSEQITPDGNSSAQDVVQDAPQPADEQSLIDIVWTQEQYPDYVMHLGDAVIDVASMPEEGDIAYSDLDALGRAGTAKATLTEKNRTDNVREDLPDPAGWPKNEKISIAMKNGKVYNGWAWNRSHLIADSLGGEEIVENLVTGTRTQNVGANDLEGGMGYTEEIARNYLDDTVLPVLYYQVTPVYSGNELIPRGCIVDIMSDDKTINERVWVFNTMNGYDIDYSTGKLAAK